IAGVLLLLLTLGMAFTGQVLRFDQDAYWGLGIGASISSRVPFIGHAIVDLLLGGPIIAGATLSRFFALHVWVVPGLLIAFVSLPARSSRPRRNQTSSSGGSTPSSRICRPRPKLLSCSSRRPSASRFSSRCRFSPAKARRAGSAGRSRSSSCFSSRWGGAR